MPQFIPIMMPMGFGPGPYYPQPYMPMYNYGRQYDQRVSPEDVEIGRTSDRVNDKNKKIMHHKTSEQIINEFKTQTLPKLRLSRLVKIQALMRGYYVRKFKIPEIKRKHRMYKQIAEKKLNEFLEVELDYFA